MSICYFLLVIQLVLFLIDKNAGSSFRLFTRKKLTSEWPYFKMMLSEREKKIVLSDNDWSKSTLKETLFSQFGFLIFDNKFQTKVRDLFSVCITGFSQNRKAVPFNHILKDVAVNILLGTVGDASCFRYTFLSHQAGRHKKSLRMSQRR